MTKCPLLLLLTCSTTIAITACGSSGDSPTTAPKDTAAPAGPTVVASTSWTGALAKAAGAGKVTLIAPASFQHPPDYEPKPSDLAAVSKADFVVLAEYDGFAKQLRSAVGGNAKVVGLFPENAPAKVRADVIRLGKAFGTTAKASAWIKTFNRTYRTLSANTKRKVAGKTAIAQAFAAPWASFAGLKLLGTYGPKPITPSQLATLKGKHAQLLIENTNLPQGKALEGSGIKQVSLPNYPTAGLDLLQVFRKNAATLQAAAR